MMNIGLQSAHVIQVGWGYVLMLIAITFNVWLFLAKCFGTGVRKSHKRDQ